MYCPQCGLALSASHKRCPHCGETDLIRPVAQLARPQSAHPQQSDSQQADFQTRPQNAKPKDLAVAPKRRAKIAGGSVIVVLALIVGLFLYRQNPSGWQEKWQNGLQKARLSLAATPDNCGVMAPDECRWVVEANRILRSSLAMEKRQGEVPVARLARLSDTIGQAKADYQLLPPVPPRCFAAKSLLSRALSEARISVTLAKKALEASTAGTKAPSNVVPLAEIIRSANQHRERAGTLYLACSRELERLFNSPEAAPLSLTP